MGNKHTVFPRPSVKEMERQEAIANRKALRAFAEQKKAEQLAKAEKQAEMDAIERFAEAVEEVETPS